MKIRLQYRLWDLMVLFIEGGESIRRASWPPGDHVSFDGAEGGALWYYSDDQDELTPGYGFTFDDIVAQDWEVQYPHGESPTA